MIRLYSVSKAYQPGKNTLEDLTLRIREGEFTFLTGVSGAGKSTLLKLLFGAERVTGGQVLIQGRHLGRIGRKLPLLRREIGVVFQDFKLISNRNVFENVAVTLEVQGVGAKEIRKRVEHVLRSVGLENRQLSYPPQLSGGEQQRVSVARAIIGQPKILLADEPTGNLDDESARGVMDLLHDAHRKGATVVVATHDSSLYSESYQRVIKLSRGSIAADSRPVPMEDE